MNIFFAKALRDAPNRLDFKEYEDDEIKKYRELLEGVIVDSSGRYVVVDGGGDFRHHKTRICTISKINNGLFGVMLADYDQEFYPGTKYAEYSEAVVGSEIQP